MARHALFERADSVKQFTVHPTNAASLQQGRRIHYPHVMHLVQIGLQVSFVRVPTITSMRIPGRAARLAVLAYNLKCLTNWTGTDWTLAAVRA